MVYMGSKNRLAKFILPIMLQKVKDKSITNWIEPFVGGGNIIDKIPKELKRVGIDYSAHAIESLIAVRDLVDKLPAEVTVEYYKSLKDTPPNPITSWVRFVCSFGGKFENGYARNKKDQNYALCGVRNAQKQSPNLQGVRFINDSYEVCSKAVNCLIYCDPPYQSTTSYKTGTFDHDKFWQWCREMSVKNSVYISEYNAPKDFECVWKGEQKTNFASTRKGATHVAIEKLFKYKG